MLVLSPKIQIILFWEFSFCLLHNFYSVKDTTSFCYLFTIFQTTIFFNIQITSWGTQDTFSANKTNSTFQFSLFRHHFRIAFHVARLITRLRGGVGGTLSGPSPISPPFILTVTFGTAPREIFPQGGISFSLQLSFPQVSLLA